MHLAAVRRMAGRDMTKEVGELDCLLMGGRLKWAADGANLAAI